MGFIKHEIKIAYVQRLIYCAQILRNDYFFKVVYDLFSCHNNSKLDAKIYQTTRGITLLDEINKINLYFNQSKNNAKGNDNYAMQQM